MIIALRKKIKSLLANGSSKCTLGQTEDDQELAAFCFFVLHSAIYENDKLCLIAKVSS